MRKISITALTGLLCAALMPAVLSCADSNRSTEWADIDNSAWPYGKKIVFNAQHTDLTAAETVLLTIRHNDAYAYANVWVELKYRSPQADTLVADTFNVRLANSFGRWLGKGNGTLFSRSDTLALRHKVTPGSGFVLRHIMRVDTVRDIEQIGLAY